MEPNNLPPSSSSLSLIGFFFIGFGLFVGGPKLLTYISSYTSQLPEIQEKNSGAKSPDDKNSDELIKLSLRVERSDRSLVDNATVEVMSQGVPETKMTDTNGYTSFEVQQQDEITITIRKSGCQTATYNVSTKTNPKNAKTLLITCKQSP